MNTWWTLTVGGFASGAVYAALGLSLVIIFRATRVVNFAQPALALLSTYFAFTVNQVTGTYWLGFAVAIVAGAVLGALSDRLLIRPARAHGELGSVIVTLGLLLVVQAVAGMLWTSEPRSFGYAFDFRGLFSAANVFAVLVVLVTAAGVLLLFKFTSLGLRMRAAAFAPEAAALAGVRVGLMVTAGTALAAAVGALAGLLAVPPLLYPTVLDGIFVYSLTAAVIGGLDNPIGTVIAGFGTGIGLSYVSGYLGPELVTLAALAILVVVLSVRPHGLFGRGLARRV
ncbi:branched-chain amino acid ABC transporter permease [Kibdelosporangium persicum]|uniref:High-affinity branched-chain amino acid transpor t system permease protein BraD n=1 Tax=Kibdelosporangium persicum TaxID=2698649 RepID=A0ABX2EZ11_9PSEU|nr:branched-chain amino acid ABC transporter permease [Kibdelosporangium persicum]NRN64283.1 High-affinity branched-chain amino acid transpor t system permease protein BraD [Kibdelosporangium persicum]